MGKMNNIPGLAFWILIVSGMAASTVCGAFDKEDLWTDLYDELSTSFTSRAVKHGLKEKSFKDYDCACVRKRSQKPFVRQTEPEFLSSEEKPMLRSKTGNRRSNTLGSKLDSLLDQVPPFPNLPDIPPMPRSRKSDKIPSGGKTTGYSYKTEISTYQENDDPPVVEGYEVFEDYATGKKVVKQYGS